MQHLKVGTNLGPELSVQEAEVATKLLSWMLQQSSTCDNARSRADLYETAAYLYEATKDRHQIFPENMLSDPAWEMLIALYYIESKRQKVTVSGLCAASAAASSTALRWLAILEKLGFVVREEHPTDRRCTFVRMTPASHEKMDCYLGRLRERILSVR